MGEFMKIGIIFAMESELNALKEYLEVIKVYDLFDLKFYEARYKNINEMELIGRGYVQTEFADKILARTGTYEYLLNTAKLSLVGVAIGLVTVIAVFMLETIMKNRKLWFTCPIVFIVVFINFNVLLFKEAIPDFLFLILNLTSILMAFCYARIERAIQTRECLMLLEQEKTVNVYSSEGN